MDTDEILFQKRLKELADKAYMGSRYCFTDFLSMAEQSIYYQMERELSYVPVTVFGGTADCERVMLRFGDETLCGYEEPFPIACLEISPLTEKFCEDLNHRDYLGALMNLGITRAMLGDIAVVREQEGACHAFLFCVERMASYIINELVQVRHTRVRCEPAERIPQSVVTRLERKTVQVSAQRADSIVARLYNLSRSESVELFRAKKVFVNGRVSESGSVRLNAGDKVSVRGFGRFCFVGVSGETRKGKLNAQADLYL